METHYEGTVLPNVSVADKGYICAISVKSESEIPKALRLLTKNVGATEAILYDYAKAQKSDEVRQFITSIKASLSILETGTPWSN